MAFDGNHTGAALSLREAIRGTQGRALSRAPAACLELGLTWYSSRQPASAAEP